MTPSDAKYYMRSMRPHVIDDLALFSGRSLEKSSKSVH